MKLLLHSCCAPCSTSVIDRLLKEGYKITVFYYNPNIFPQEEYIHRLSEQKRYIREHLNDVDIIEGDWDNNLYEQAIKGLEACKEGGARCTKCFYLRLEKTAQLAKELKFDLWTTTMSVSPHKNAQLLNQIGEELEKKYDAKYLLADFKKQDGYLKSIKMSKEYGIYRQDYCGCKYSIYKN